MKNSAMPSMSVMTGYLYDANGARVAKGTITTMSCDPAMNGFQFTKSYVLGPGGETLTTLDGNNTWLRTNVYVGGRLMATYDQAGLHFHLTDPLGTRRVQLSGNLTSSDQTLPLGQAELDCTSLPFGDQQSCVPAPNAPPTSDDATPLHFTGKERDTESGNDYFGARYYASSMGRWLSPDWSAKAEPVPYAKMGNPQSLNLYAYVRNNPLRGVDPDGHDYLTTDPTEMDNSEAETDSSQSVADQQQDQQEAQLQLSNAQNAAMKNPQFAPGYGGHTHCNQGACSVARAMHAPMGPLSNAKGKPLLADQIRANLAKPGSGYHGVSAAEATQLAPQGVVVFVTGPGHIATVAADQSQKLPGSGPIISNVGYKNGDMRLNYVFPKSDLPQVRFYTPNQ